MVQRRERVKTSHCIADFQVLNQNQAQVTTALPPSMLAELICVQAGHPLVELDDALARRAQKVRCAHCIRAQI
jgi:hypothetical protein